MTEIALLNQDIARIISDLNASNNKQTRHLSATRAIVDGNKVTFALGVGTAWHTINIYEDGWTFAKPDDSDTEAIAEQVMHNLIYPIIPDERIDLILTETPSFAIQLASLREEAGLSLRQLSAMSGVGFTHIQRIEQGHDASIRTINKLCAALGATLTIE